MRLCGYYSVCHPAPSQTEIVARIEEEQKLVEANKKLIELFEGKIKEKIAEVWG
jgi:type I restriction enzyme M protein